MVSALDSEASGPGSDPRKIVLCSWARHFTLTVPFSNQVSTCKWVPGNFMLGDNPAMDKHPIQRE